MYPTETSIPIGSFSMRVGLKKNGSVKVEIEFLIQYGISWSQPQVSDSWKKKKKPNQKGLANLNRKNPVEHRKQEGSSIKTVLG